MNKNERSMVDILKRGRDEFGYISAKAEFEAEGTRVDELLRLMEISHSAGVKLTVKIGGCEAIRDLLESKQFGVDFIVAPMIESDYALGKYALARDKVYSNDEQSDTDFLFNLETHNTFLSREKILDLASELNLAGVVFGRSDYSGSLGLPPSEIESERVTGDILEVARNCSERSLDLVVGGAVNINSIENLKKIREIHLTRFETRKIVFDGESVFNENIEDGLFNAVQFELKWLLNKKQYYSSISNEDNKRFDTLKARWGLVED
jgi:hypothetical protein